jgi:hypothetical protein
MQNLRIRAQISRANSAAFHIHIQISVLITWITRRTQVIKSFHWEGILANSGTPKSLSHGLVAVKDEMVLVAKLPIIDFRRFQIEDDDDDDSIESW